MRMSLFILSLVAATLVMASASAQDSGNKSGQEAVAEPANRVKELQQERIATLKTLLEVNATLLKIAKASPETVLETRLLVLEAELEAAKKQTERIELYTNLVDVLKEYEDVAVQRKADARATEAFVLEIRARRLKAEIRLEQAKAKHPDLGDQAIMLASPRIKDVVVTQQYVGQIRARRHIDIHSLLRGQVEEITVKEGQSVRKGDVLFRMAAALYTAKLDAESAEAKLAELNLKNAETLAQKAVVSPFEVSQFQAKLAHAQAKVKAAAAELNFTLIRAPFDGVIGRLQVQQGSVITEQDRLATLSDNSGIWVYFNVPQERYLEYLSGPDEGRNGEVELVLADGSKFPQRGQIAAVGAQFESATGNIPFRADFPNPAGLLRHGMTGTLLIQHTLHDAIVIPQQATFEMHDQRFVYVVDKDNVAHQREIVVRNELDGDSFVIQQGLDAGDRIVVSGVRQVRDGEKLPYESPKR